MIIQFVIEYLLLQVLLYEQDVLILYFINQIYTFLYWVHLLLFIKHSYDMTK